MDIRKEGKKEGKKEEGSKKEVKEWAEGGRGLLLLSFFFYET